MRGSRWTRRGGGYADPASIVGVFLIYYQWGVLHWEPGIWLVSLIVVVAPSRFIKGVLPDLRAWRHLLPHRRCLCRVSRPPLPFCVPNLAESWSRLSSRRFDLASVECSTRLKSTRTLAVERPDSQQIKRLGHSKSRRLAIPSLVTLGEMRSPTDFILLAVNAGKVAKVGLMLEFADHAARSHCRQRKLAVYVLLARVNRFGY